MRKLSQNPGQNQGEVMAQDRGRKGRRGMGQGLNRSMGPGQGQRRGMGRDGGFRLGPGGDCICPNCGYRAPHDIGVPCFNMNCPQCGTRMTRTK